MYFHITKNKNTTSFNCYLEVRYYGCIQMLNKSWFFQGPKEVHPCENFVESHINKVFVNYLARCQRQTATVYMPKTCPVSHVLEEEGLSPCLLRSPSGIKNDSSQWSNVLEKSDPGHTVTVGLRRAAKVI